MTNNRRTLRSVQTFGRHLWTLVRPYWFSEERWIALGLLGMVVGLNLGIVYINVLLNAWNRTFFDAIQQKDFPTFRTQLFVFTGLALAYIAMAVYQLYLTQKLEIRWRRWLSTLYYRDWLAHRVYYRMELKDYGTDNPEQRIQDDIRLFASNTLRLSMGLLSSIVTLASFLSILWTLSGALHFSVFGMAISIPAYMVWVAVLYAGFGSLGAHWIGRPLVRINFEQQQYEADFRYRMGRIREHAESIALYGGEDEERQGLDGAFHYVWQNWWKLMKRQKSLTWFTATYGQLANIFPIMVAAPRYFSGAIELGVLFQISSAFGQVQGALSWFIDVYPQFADWRATVERLITFREAMRQADQEATAHEGIVCEPHHGTSLEVQQLDLALPTGRVLLNHINARIDAGETLLITGPSGSGKTTFFRALAGIWPFGKGAIRLPDNARVLFLPQKPYLPLGTLQDAVCYPAGAAQHDDATLTAVLQRCKLPHLSTRLHETGNWGFMLSVGEQQRLAFARALLQRPDWLFLDEATSALDEATEHHLYDLILRELPGLTMLSIAHRSTVAAFHQQCLHIDPEVQDISVQPLPARPRVL